MFLSYILHLTDTRDEYTFTFNSSGLKLENQCTMLQWNVSLLIQHPTVLDRKGIYSNCSEPYAFRVDDYNHFSMIFLAI